MKKTCAVLAIFLATIGTMWQPFEVRSADPKPPAHPHHRSPCADACAACANSCSACVEHCLLLTLEGKKEHAAVLRLCNDCADVCSIAAKIESRQGPLRMLICEACAKACDECAAECVKYKEQPQMVDCAKACTSCANDCREMVDMIKHAPHSK